MFWRWLLSVIWKFFPSSKQKYSIYVYTNCCTCRLHCPLRTLLDVPTWIGVQHIWISSTWAIVFHLNLTNIGASWSKSWWWQCFHLPYEFGMLLIFGMYKDHVAFMVNNSHTKMMEPIDCVHGQCNSSTTNSSLMSPWLKNITLSRLNGITQICGQNMCVKVDWVMTPTVWKVDQMQSQHAINDSCGSQTIILMSSSLNSFQYSVNPNIIVDDFQFLMGWVCKALALLLVAYHFHGHLGTKQVLHPLVPNSIQYTKF